MNHVTATFLRPQMECSEAAATEYPFGSAGWQPVHLRKGALQTQRLDAEEIVEIHILVGAAWVTLEGDFNDHVLSAGDSQVLRGPGLLVVEGLMEVNSAEQLRSRV